MSERAVTIALAGDTMLGRRVARAMSLRLVHARAGYTRSRMWRATAGAVSVLALVFASGACRSEPRSFGVEIAAELLGEAPFTIDERERSVTLERKATAGHSLIFEATQPVVLDDVRWTFASTRGGRVFASSGHGCGPSIVTDGGAVQFACTDDYRFLSVEPGRPLTETITIHGGLEDRGMATGRFVFRQPITWWHAGDDPLDPRGRIGGEVTVTLTYEVRAR